jgi:hypothetical protein
MRADNHTLRIYENSSIEGKLYPPFELWIARSKTNRLDYVDSFRAFAKRQNSISALFEKNFTRMTLAFRGSAVPKRRLRLSPQFLRKPSTNDRLWYVEVDLERPIPDSHP